MARLLRSTDCRRALLAGHDEYGPQYSAGHPVTAKFELGLMLNPLEGIAPFDTSQYPTRRRSREFGGGLDATYCRGFRTRSCTS
jgi:hypothetical protein